MKKFLLVLLVCFLITELYSQSNYYSKNRHYPIEIDKTIDGIWSGPDTTASDVADSIYLYKTGIPDYGDLFVPDLELKMKSLWYESKVYFLFRHLDDVLVNDITEDSLSEGLENRDATALYFFLDTSNARLYDTSIIYRDNLYTDSIAWIRWVWGTDDFEGELRGESIYSIADLGGEFIQWIDGNYSYAKLSVDLASFSSLYNSLDYKRLGFDIELDENDKEVFYADSYGIQTRAFWGSDMDSSALKPQNISNWNWLSFSSGDSCVVCNTPASIGFSEVNFARIYPNPASEYIIVQLETTDKVKYRIYNLMGQLVKSDSFIGSEQLISLGDIKVGTYYMQLMNNKGSIMTSKLLIFR